MTSPISFSELQSAIRGRQPPLVIDVRKQPAFKAATDMIAGALRRDPETVTSWARELPSASTVVAYCLHGHGVSRGVATALNGYGIKAHYLEGGIEEGWKAKNGDLDRKPADATSRWVTRERPKIDRIACPWLIARFVDKQAEFLSRTFSDDHEMLEHGMVMYDALYAWCKEGQDEVHTWNPDAYR